MSSVRDAIWYFGFSIKELIEYFHGFDVMTMNISKTQKIKEQMKRTLHVFNQPFRTGGMWHEVIFFKGFLFSAFILQDLLLNQGYRTQSALLTDEGRIIVSLPFPRILVPWEMQSASSKIRTPVAASILYIHGHHGHLHLIVT